MKSLSHRHGIHLLKFTGRFSSTDPQYIELQYPGTDGVTCFARPCYTFPFVSAPSEEWLQQYKNQFLAACICEHGITDIVIWVGIVPIDDKVTDQFSFPNSHVLRTRKYILHVDDDNEKFVIQQINNPAQTITVEKDQVFISSRAINLGSNNPPHTVNYWDTLKVQLEREKARMDALISAIDNVTTISGDGGAAIKAAIVAATSTLQAADYSQGIESPVVKLE